MYFQIHPTSLCELCEIRMHMKMSSKKFLVVFLFLIFGVNLEVHFRMH